MVASPFRISPRRTTTLSPKRRSPQKKGSPRASPAKRSPKVATSLTALSKRPKREAHTYYVGIYQTRDVDPLKFRGLIRKATQSMRKLPPGSPERITQKKAAEMIDTHYHPMRLVHYGAITSDFLPGSIAKAFYKRRVGEKVNPGFLTTLVAVYDPQTRTVTAFSNFKSFYANHTKASLAMKTMAVVHNIPTAAAFKALKWVRSHGKFSVVK